MDTCIVLSCGTDVLQAASENIPALVLMGLGTLLLFWGTRRGARAARRSHEDPPKALGIVRGYRIAIIGVCLSAYGAGQWWRIDWLMTVAIVICLEEIAESSFYIAALKREPTPMSLLNMKRS